jgi:hypothetical protein
MTKRLLLIAALLLPVSALALPSNQVLVLTTATRVDTAGFAQRAGVVIQNNGPNAIYCRVGSTTSLAVNYGYFIAAGGGVWSFPLPAQVPVYCISATANQVAGAATDVTEF